MAYPENQEVTGEENRTAPLAGGSSELNHLGNSLSSNFIFRIRVDLLQVFGGQCRYIFRLKLPQAKRGKVMEYLSIWLFLKLCLIIDGMEKSLQTITRCLMETDAK